MGAKVLQINPTERARILARDWRRCPLPEVVVRCRALAALHAMGHRLPSDAYDAWLQMSAVVTVAGGK